MRVGALLVASVVLAFMLSFARPAHAGSYLDRATVLLDGSRHDLVMLRARLTDKELARVIWTVARARSDAAQRMDVPPQVAKAHPHMLLVLTHAERAAEAALDGNFKAAVEHLDGARLEETLFRAALKEAGFPLPAPSARPPAARRLAPAAP
jgi:hypothetical protein